jgi:hypothetical protein
MRRFRWFAWWYLAIALGFLLLAANRALVGEKLWLIGLRLVIAAGFGVLSWFEFRAGNRRE